MAYLVVEIEVETLYLNVALAKEFSYGKLKLRESIL